VGHERSIFIDNSEVDGNGFAGIRLMDVGNTSVFQTQASLNIPRSSDGRFGDGLIAWSAEKVTVNQCEFDLNSRAGISNFGCDPNDSSLIEIGASHLENNGINLDGEGWDIPQQIECDTGFQFNDLGDNTCI
jgi:hypothetical protein